MMKKILMENETTKKEFLLIPYIEVEAYIILTAQMISLDYFE